MCGFGRLGLGADLFGTIAGWTRDVVDAVRVEARVALPELVDQADHEVDRLHLVQRTCCLALATRGPEVVVHECFCHVLDCDSIGVTVNRGQGVA
jgi:hypothetical protein